jgi:hypothetical protein
LEGKQGQDDFVGREVGNLMYATLTALKDRAVGNIMFKTEPVKLWFQPKRTDPCRSVCDQPSKSLQTLKMLGNIMIENKRMVQVLSGNDDTLGKQTKIENDKITKRKKKVKEGKDFIGRNFVSAAKSIHQL